MPRPCGIGGIFLRSLIPKLPINIQLRYNDSCMGIAVSFFSVRPFLEVHSKANISALLAAKCQNSAQAFPSNGH